MGAKRVLGRGVDALLPEEQEGGEGSRFFMCDIDRVVVNPNQPRSYFDKEKLTQLADSIKENGIIQPLLVVRAEGNRYHLIAGERRLRAARMARQEEVPVVLMDEASEHQRLELALIENIQRHDLNPIEEARAYRRLIKEFGLTQEQVATKVGRQRSTITNTLRLLALPDEVQDDVIYGRLSEGHARVLLRLKDDPQRLAAVREQIVAGHLSVRAAEKLCRQTVDKHKDAKPKARGRAAQQATLPASYCQALEARLTNVLNTRVRVVQNGSRGRLEIDYFSSDDLDRLVSFLARGREG